MTANQIAYQNLQELKRSNATKEKETERHNRSTEALGFATLGETGRHNVATEQQALGVLAETERSNRAKEDQNYLNYVETQRSNVAKETETKRSNIAREEEATRTNQANEMIKIGQNRIDQLKHQETARHNKHTEVQGYISSVSSALKNVIGAVEDVASMVMAGKLMD